MHSGVQEYRVCSGSERVDEEAAKGIMSIRFQRKDKGRKGKWLDCGIKH